MEKREKKELKESKKQIENDSSVSLQRPTSEREEDGNNNLQMADYNNIDKELLKDRRYADGGSDDSSALKSQNNCEWDEEVSENGYNMTPSAA